MLNHLKHNKFSFVHFPGSSSWVLVAIHRQTIMWWKIRAALPFRSCLTWLHTFSWQKIDILINWLPAFLTRQSRERLRSLHDVPQNIRPTDSIEWHWGRVCWGVGGTSRYLPGNRGTLSTATILLCVAPNSTNSSLHSVLIKYHFSHYINHHQSIHELIFHTVDSDMSIVMIRRGGAYGTKINHEKRNNQRDLDVHGRCECRQQGILSMTIREISSQHYWPPTAIFCCWAIAHSNENMVCAFFTSAWSYLSVLRWASIVRLGFWEAGMFIGGFLREFWSLI
jgi:hypothetical protein